MASRNQSPNYLREREVVRAFLTRTKEGQFAADLITRKRQAGEPNVLDDDEWVDWEEIMREHQHDTIIAASCREARQAAELARQSSSTLAAPMGKHSKMRRFFSPPIWYVLRRQIETADPDYWNQPVNIYREALENIEWAVMPADYLRGQLEALLPRGTKIAIPTSAPKPLLISVPEG